MITAQHNYDNGYIALVDLSLRNLPETIRFKDYLLYQKDEFHISLVCVKRIAEIIAPNDKEQVQGEIVEQFKQFSSQHPLSSYSLTNELRFVERDSRKTVVVMTKVPSLDIFFQEISKRYDTELPLQPTHITLYTLQKNAGIGILSNEELDDDSVSINVTELSGIKSFNQ